MKLYELGEELSKLQEAAYSATDEEFEAMVKRFEELKSLSKEKLEDTGRLLRELEAQQEALLQESKFLKLKAEILESRSKRIKEYVGFCLGEGNSVKSGVFSWYWQETTSVDVVDADRIPEAYLRIIPEKREPDKRQMLQDFRALGTKEIPGVEFITKNGLRVK